MHVLPSSRVASSLSTFSIPVSTWELIFHTTEQQRQLSNVERWSKAVQRKTFTMAGIFGKQVLACTHLRSNGNAYANEIFLKQMWAVK